jgi:cytochrome P450
VQALSDAAIDFDPRETSQFATRRCEATFLRLRRRGALPVDTRGRVPVYSLVRYEDIARAYGEPELYSPRAGLTLDTLDPAAAGSAKAMLEMAPPARHRALRSAMADLFQGADVERLTGSTHDMVDRFVRLAARRGAVEFVDGLAQPLAASTMCALLGVTSAQATPLARVLRAVGAIDFGCSQQSQWHRRTTELWLLRELTGIVRAQRLSGRADGLIGRLLTADVEGSRLAEHEVALNCMNVVIAGTGATQHTLAGAVVVWSEHGRALDDAARDPKLARGLVEETLRWLTPVIHLTRILERDVEIMGREVPKGSGICMWNISANRDEEAFEQPTVFRPERAGNRHLAFGVGPQYCLGAQLARMQLRALLGGVLRAGVRFVPRAAPVWLQSNAIAGVRELLVGVRRVRPVDAAW